MKLSRGKFCAIGIGTPLTGRPSHTTQHTGPYCAIRLIKTDTNEHNEHLVCLALGNATLPAFSRQRRDCIIPVRTRSLTAMTIYPHHSAGHRSGLRRGESSPLQRGSFPLTNMPSADSSPRAFAVSCLGRTASSPYTVTDIQSPYCYILRLHLAGSGTCNIP